jgi:hypothetical protein
MGCLATCVLKSKTNGKYWTGDCRAFLATDKASAYWFPVSMTPEWFDKERHILIDGLNKNS